MEYLEDTQYFDEDVIPNSVHLDDGENFSNEKGN